MKALGNKQKFDMHIYFIRKEHIFSSFLLTVFCSLSVGPLISVFCSFHFQFQLCVEYLEENLSVQNACDCMQAAVTYSQDDLKEKTLIYIEQHTEVWMTSLAVLWLFQLYFSLIEPLERV